MDHEEQTTDRPDWRRFAMIAAVAHVAIALGIHWSDALLRSLAPIQVGVALLLGALWVARERGAPILGAAAGVLVGAAVGGMLSVLLRDQPWWFLLIGPPGQAVTAALGGWVARPILDRLGIRSGRPSS